jgi:hypothetical protein
LSQVVAGSVAGAALELTAFRAMSGQTLRVYGLDHEAANQSWDEASATFANVPGLAFDGNSGTRSLDLSKLLLLGEFNTGAVAEGATVTLADADLAVFLNLLAYRTGGGDVATLLVERQNNSATEARFASAEATMLETGSPAAAGTYAPRLRLEAITRPAGDFDGDGEADAGDLSIWRAGFGTEIGASWRYGDADADGDVDGSDLLVWQRQAATGGVAAVRSTAVPEPSTMGLWALAIFARRMAMAAPRRSSGAR